MTVSPIKWSFEELQIKLPKQLMIRRSRKKQNEGKNNCLMDFGNTYNKSPLLSYCFLLKFFYRVFKKFARIRRTQIPFFGSIYLTCIFIY